MTNHTPGPWTFTGPHIIGDGHSRVALVRTFYNNERKKETDANTALIAAAPDLLAALESIVEVLNRRGDDHSTTNFRAWKIARKAIKKAKNHD